MEPAWRAAFVRDATPALRNRAVSFVRRRLRGDDSEADELVQDVLADTYLGVLSWDPAKHSLISHVCLALRARLYRTRARAVALPHVSLESCDDTLGAEVEDTLLATSTASVPADMRLATQVLARLRERAVSDPDVIALLDAMCAGFLEREQLLDAVGADVRRYASARARLDRMVEDLPHSAAVFGAAGVRPSGAPLPVTAPPPRARTPGGRIRGGAAVPASRGQGTASAPENNHEAPFQGHLPAGSVALPDVVLDEEPAPKSPGHVDPPPHVTTHAAPHFETLSGGAAPQGDHLSAPS